MTTKIYYIENSATLDAALTTIINAIPCFVKREIIELDWVKVEFIAREEDLAFIEKCLAPLV